MEAHIDLFSGVFFSFSLFGFFLVLGAGIDKLFPALETSALQIAFAGSLMAVSLVHFMT